MRPAHGAKGLGGLEAFLASGSARQIFIIVARCWLMLECRSLMLVYNTAAYLGFIRHIDAGPRQDRSYRACFCKLRAEAMFLGRCFSNQTKTLREVLT